MVHALETQRYGVRLGFSRGQSILFFLSQSRKAAMIWRSLMFLAKSQ